MGGAVSAVALVSRLEVGSALDELLGVVLAAVGRHVPRGVPIARSLLISGDGTLVDDAGAAWWVEEAGGERVARSLDVRGGVEFTNYRHGQEESRSVVLWPSDGPATGVP